MNVNDITVTFGTPGKEIIVLAALNISIEDSVSGIYGQKKSGKTTLAKTLTGYIKPLTGSIDFASNFKLSLLRRKSISKKFTLLRGKNKLWPVYSDIKQAKDHFTEILILDEIKYFSKLELSELLEQRKAKGGISILLSDDLFLLEQYTKNIHLLRDGRLIPKENLSLKSDAVFEN